MPQIDSKTGRQLSGAKRRTAAKKCTTAYRTTVANSPAPIPSTADFAQLAPSPLGSPTEAIAWCNDALLVVLGQVMRDAALSNLERWRWSKDRAAVMGMCRDKVERAGPTQEARRTVRIGPQRDQARGIQAPCRHQQATDFSMSSRRSSQAATSTSASSSSTRT